MKNFKKLTMYDERIKTTASNSTDPLLGLDNVSKRFIIEVFLGDRRLEYRASDNEDEIKKELEILKRTYKSSNCVFYLGSLNAC